MDLLYFIHIPKTAGTYVTQTLAAPLGPRFVREGHTVPASILRPWLERFGPAHFSTVPRARCTVFTVVRNPFDLLVSMYSFGFPYWAPRYARQHQRIEWPFRSFRDFVRRLCQWDDYPWIVPAQRKSLFFQLFDDDGTFLPDHVLRQENLSTGIAELAGIIGVEARPPEKRVNVSRTAHYGDYYDDELVALVERRFGGDLEAFGYRFDGHDGRSLFRPDNLCYDHQNGVYHGLTGSRPAYRGPPLTGRLADVDLHPWKDDVLSRFTGRALATECYGRLLRRLGMVRSKPDQGE